MLRENAGPARPRACGSSPMKSAHFWLGEAVTYEYARDQPGSPRAAPTCSPSASSPRSTRPMTGAPNCRQAIDDCVRLQHRARRRQRASERNEQRAYYACGAVFGLVAEAASRRPFGAFVRRLIDANRADGVLTRAEWLAGARSRCRAIPRSAATSARCSISGARRSRGGDRLALHPRRRPLHAWPERRAEAAMTPFEKRITAQPRRHRRARPCQQCRLGALDPGHGDRALARGRAARPCRRLCLGRDPPRDRLSARRPARRDGDRPDLGRRGAEGRALRPPCRVHSARTARSGSGRGPPGRSSTRRRAGRCACPPEVAAPFLA